MRAAANTALASDNGATKLAERSGGKTYRLSRGAAIAIKASPTTNGLSSFKLRKWGLQSLDLIRATAITMVIIYHGIQMLPTA
jgi:peptidoglycan/LPS O-acetylase OafA/YrhL